jgi:hypothetical protein
MKAYIQRRSPVWLISTVGWLLWLCVAEYFWPGVSVVALICTFWAGSIIIDIAEGFERG